MTPVTSQDDTIQNSSFKPPTYLTNITRLNDAHHQMPKNISRALLYKMYKKRGKRRF
jgi:hypothetical protein